MSRSFWFLSSSRNGGWKVRSEIAQSRWLESSFRDRTESVATRRRRSVAIAKMRQAERKKRDRRFRFGSITLTVLLAVIFLITVYWLTVPAPVIEWSNCDNKKEGYEKINCYKQLGIDQTNFPKASFKEHRRRFTQSIAWWNLFTVGLYFVISIFLLWQRVREKYLPEWCRSKDKLHPLVRRFFLNGLLGGWTRGLFRVGVLGCILLSISIPERLEGYTALEKWLYEYLIAWFITLWTGQKIVDVQMVVRYEVSKLEAITSFIIRYAGYVYPPGWNDSDWGGTNWLKEYRRGKGWGEKEPYFGLAKCNYDIPFQGADKTDELKNRAMEDLKQAGWCLRKYSWVSFVGVALATLVVVELLAYFPELWVATGQQGFGGLAWLLTDSDGNQQTPPTKGLQMQWGGEGDAGGGRGEGGRKISSSTEKKEKKRYTKGRRRVGMGTFRGKFD